MTDTTYNGWTNRETWLVNLWFGDYFAELAEEGERIDAEYIQTFVWGHVEDHTRGASGFLNDLLDLSGIDWDELASHYAPEADEADDEEG